MEMYIIERGHILEQKRFNEDVSDCVVPYEYKKGKKGALKLGMRQITLWCVAFPEKELQNVLDIIKPSIEDYGGKYKFLTKLIQRLSRILGLESLPKGVTIDCTKKFEHDKYAVGKHFLGIKKDSYDKDGIELI